MLGVEHQVQQGLLEQVSIEPDRREIGVELGPNDDRLHRRGGLVEVANLFDDRVQVNGFQLQVLDAGEPEEVLEDAMQPEDFVLEPLDPLANPTVARRLAVLKILGQQVEVQPEGRERIADLVGESAGKLRDLGILVRSRRVTSRSSRSWDGMGAAGCRESGATETEADRSGAAGPPATVTPEFVGALTAASETVLDRRFAMGNLAGSRTKVETARLE